ncbi:hypothetical protein Hanom_Chr12g01142181 [Helianthus anomalus]
MENAQRIEMSRRRTVAYEFYALTFLYCFISLMIPSVRASTSLFFPKNLINSMFGSIKYLSNTLSITHFEKKNLNFRFAKSFQG